MAISRFNYTGLRKINRRDVRITLQGVEDNRYQFVAELSLAEYRFPADSLVFIEAYRQTTLMRFAFGSVKAIVCPVDTTLTEFGSVDDIRFRVRVTAAGENSGKMLGRADQIRPVGEIDDDDERSPLLNVRPAEIGDEVYRVEMDQPPVLLINRNIGDWRAVVASPIFQSLAAPTILRAVLTHLLVVEGASDSDDMESSSSRWLRFADSLPGVPERPDDKDAHLGWIEDVVACFARQKQFLTSFTNAWKKG